MVEEEASDELVSPWRSGPVQEVALRAQAETQNIRRRAEQDVEKAHGCVGKIR